LVIVGCDDPIKHDQEDEPDLEDALFDPQAEIRRIRPSTASRRSRRVEDRDGSRLKMPS